MFVVSTDDWEGITSTVVNSNLEYLIFDTEESAHNFAVTMPESVFHYSVISLNTKV